MDWKIFFTLVNIWCALAVVTTHPAHPSHATSEQKFIKYFKHGEERVVVRPGSDKGEHHEEYETYPSYEFSYKVMDPHTHDYKGQQEKRDGDKVNGDYWLVEPDGRKRVVKYHANDKIGFNVLIDYLKKDHDHPFVNKMEKKTENDKEKRIEVKPSSEKASNGNEKSNEEKISLEQNEQKQSQNDERQSNESTEINEKLLRNIKKAFEQMSQNGGKRPISEVKLKKNMAPKSSKEREFIESGKDKKDESRQVVREKNGNSRIENNKYSSKKEDKSNESKQEKIENDNNVGNNENKWKMHQYHSHIIHKGYEVTENVNETGAEQNGKKESTEKEDEAQSAERKDLGKTDDGKVESSDKREEVYGYNTIIYHKHHRS